MSIPRNHHFIPQFWLRRFSPTGGSMVWCYDWDADRVTEKSVSTLMSEIDLYTKQTAAGPDVSLETGELGNVDDAGAKLFQRLDAGERGAAFREEFADFLAVMMLRHPQTIDRFPELAAALLIAIDQALGCAVDAQDFNARMSSQGFGVLTLTDQQFALLASASVTDRNEAIGRIFDAVLSPSGNPDVPFADVIEQRSGRDTIKGRLLNLCWTIGNSPESGLIIGDAGLLFDRGALERGCRVALSPSRVLIIENASDAVPDTIADRDLYGGEAHGLNVEAAARSRRLLVAAGKSEIEAVKQHIWRPAA